MSKEIIGYIKSVEGDFVAKSEDGSIRELHNGDPVYYSDLVYSISRDPNSNISIDLLSTQQNLDFNGKAEAFLDTSVVYSQMAHEDTVIAPDHAKVLAEHTPTTMTDTLDNVLKEFGDNMDITETAAGHTATTNGGHPSDTFVDPTRSMADVTSSLRDIQNPVGSTPELNTAQPIEATPTTTGGDILVDEAALNSVGSDPSSNAETASGVLSVENAIGDVTYAFTAGTNGIGTYGTMTLNPDGTYSYTLTSPMNSGAVQGTNIVNNAETFSYTATDAGGNTANGTITVDIKDDIPSISVTVGQYNEEEGASTLTVDETHLGVTDSADFSYAFTSVAAPGADGQSGPITSTYTLGISTPNVDSGLIDTATGDKVLLHLENGEVVGSIKINGIETTVFTVSVDNNGIVTLEQDRAIVNPIGGDSYNEPATLITDNLITLTRSDAIIDGDGDIANSSATLNIGSNFVFLDDGPQVVTDLGDITEGHTLSVDAADGVLHNDVSGADGWAAGGAVVGVAAG
ncbi:MAG: DUF5801 repeats-in-toxin domain-containing protein, partial [Sulfurospirillaceae bacterium]|nr:DUF5801 repeats-in-toxin domain-containing protein [Sulfurospirillaceae bacterium]